MTNILEQIVTTKTQEIAPLANLLPGYWAAHYPLNYTRAGFSLSAALRQNGSTGIIAEFKRRSPSKGWFKPAGYSASEVVNGYVRAGAAGCSVLTDEFYFGGSLEDLAACRSTSALPLLRKDFIIDEVQLHQAKAYGADVVLLIAAILDPEKCLTLAGAAKKLGLEVLLEVHSKDEMNRINEYTDLVGINNRDLRDFSVDLGRSLELIRHIPQEIPVISESGINGAEDIRILKNAGFRGFLVGETFMKTTDPAAALDDFILKLEK